MSVKEKILDFVKNHIIDENETILLKDNTQLIDGCIIDSMGMIKLLTFLEEELSVKIADDELNPDNFKNIVSICKIVEKNLSTIEEI